MSTTIKKRNYRKKREDTPEDAGTPLSETGAATAEGATAQDDEPEGLSLDELIELRKFRQRPAGIAAVDLLVGDTTGKKKKKDKIVAADPYKLLSGGGLVDMDEVRRNEEGESSTKSGMMNTFTKQTNALDVDKHMMKYIEDEMKKRRGEAGDAEDAYEQPGNYNGDTDILDELGIRKTAPRPEQEGNVQLSTTMLTAIPEVDLGMDARLRNIEETEKAKRKLFEERTTTNITANERFSQPAYIPSDSERISHHRQNNRNSNNNNNNSNNRNNNYNNNNSSNQSGGGVPNHRFQNYGNSNNQGNRGGVGRGMATDDLVMERFKKRTRR
ncbi:hepatocellular carcinoma-associated antigen 59-domain-containing protein [Linnemannia elongata]|nr:hepatocellular carcinoma-associated antigen 59-domain-containing protein [Linnemannia elongata]